jgi:hypothetical protein
MDAMPNRPPPPQGSTTPTSLDIAHRRNQMAGLWAAELLGLMGQAAQDYVRAVMHPGHSEETIHEDDQDHVVAKLAKDLAAHASVTEIRDRMVAFLGEARRQLTGRRQ